MLARFHFVRAVLTASLVASTPAFAELEAAGETAPARSVDIVVVGSEANFEAVRSTVGENAFDGAAVRWSRATRLEAGSIFERRPPASDVGVRVWLDLTDEKKASFYFADRAGERFLVRSMALPDALSPLGLEAVGQVLELSVRAMLEDVSVGMSRDEIDALFAREALPPEKPPEDSERRAEPEPPSDEAARASLGAEAFYGVRLFSSAVPFVHGPGLGLAWITESAERASVVWVTGQYDLPAEHVAPAVGVEWNTLRVQGGFGFDFAVARSSVFAGGRLGAGAEFTNFSPRAGRNAESVALEPSGVSAAPVLTLAFEASVPLGERLGASARLFGSFYPVRVHFDVADATGEDEVLTPYWIRPGIELSLHLR